MAEYITINGKQYRVASNVMGVTLGLREVYGDKVPQDDQKLPVLMLVLSIMYGERLDGREADFNFEDYLLLDIEESNRIMSEFMDIWSRQHPQDEIKKKA